MTELAETVEVGDAAKAREVLRRALEPFAMLPTPEGYLMRGALDVGVRDESSSGGVIRALDIAGSLEIAVRLVA